MNERMRQTRHLASRGFNMRVIQQVIRSGGAASEVDLSDSITA
jgi:SOS response regulatory protein OraA/RecX